jgi:hypothetical protein
MIIAPMYRESFIWRACEAGYVILPVEGFPGQLKISPAGKTVRSYAPAADTFLKLAQVDPDSPEEVIEFANLYGLLKPGRPAGLRAPEKPTPYAEGLREWAREIKDFRVVVRAWQRVEAADAASLAPQLEWRKDFILFKDPLLESTLSLLADKCPKGDVLAAATQHVCEFVNDHQDSLLPRLRVQAGGRPRYSLLPESLISFMWDCCAAAIGEGYTFGNCLSCQKYVLVAPKGPRANRECCDDKCRMRLNWARRVISKMRAEGAADNTIAQRLNVSVEQLKRWAR